MDVDLRQLLSNARRWWWILALGPALFGSLAFAYTSRQIPQFRAQATLLIQPTQSSGGLDYNALLTAERLAKTYQKLITTRPVLDNVIATLHLTTGSAALAAQIKASTETDSQLLYIDVVDPDPARAAVIANEVGAQFSAYIKSQSSSADGQTLAQLDKSVKTLEDQIKATDTRIAELKANPNQADPAVTSELDSLNATLDTLRPTYGSLLSALANAQSRAAVSVDRVSVAAPAYAPSAPFAPRKLVNLILGVLGGSIIALALVTFLDYLDNTVKDSLDFPALAGGPLLATLGALGKITPGRKQLFMLDQPKGGAAESIRLLRTNIEFASATREIASVGITSANTGEGKSTVAANLAITLAQAGFNTALVDADLRRPSQHRVFDLVNDRGLSTLLSAPDRRWQWAAHESNVPNLSVIPSGPIPPNPADLLSLERLREVLDDMRGTFDVIVIDMPPVLAVSDPLIISAHVDGMILVARDGKTRIDAMKRAAATLQRGAIRIIGVVINQHSAKGGTGYYYSGDYHVVESRVPSPRPKRAKAEELPTAEPSRLERGSPAD